VPAASFEIGPPFLLRPGPGSRSWRAVPSIRLDFSPSRSLQLGSIEPLAFASVLGGSRCSLAGGHVGSFELHCPLLSFFTSLSNPAFLLSIPWLSQAPLRSPTFFHLDLEIISFRSAVPLAPRSRMVWGISVAVCKMRSASDQPLLGDALIAAFSLRRPSLLAARTTLGCVWTVMGGVLIAPFSCSESPACCAPFFDSHLREPGSMRLAIFQVLGRSRMARAARSS